MATSSEARLVDPGELRDVVVGIGQAAGVSPAAAAAMAEHMVEAHLRGVETHGLRRLRPYLARIAKGGVDATVEPAVEAHGAILRIDGRNGVGHHVATFAADAVAAQARTHGVSVALVRNSNHFGFAGYYSSRIAAGSMLGVATSNGQVMIGPDGALRPIFSNDPLAISAPYAGGGMFELDLALSVTSRQNIVRAAQTGEPLSPGTALDGEGLETTDAEAALQGLLLAFGGARGFALLSAIEVLSGVLTGGAYADLVASKEASPASPEGTGHFMLAIDLEQAVGAKAFEGRLADLVERLRGLPMREGAARPRAPGARRWQLRADRLAGGIPVAPQDMADLVDLGAEVDVVLPPDWTRAGS